MQIHELPVGTPTEQDVLPVDNGVSTRRVQFSQFEAGDNNANFTSSDSDTPTAWQSVSVMAGGTIKSILANLSKMVANVRHIYNNILNPGVVIPTNGNCNNYKATQNCICNSGTIAATVSNAPFTNSAFQMLVFQFAGMSFQIAWQNAAATFIKYRIYYSSGSWSAWTALAKGEGSLSSYLTTSSASSTYLTQTNAASTYARKDTVGTIIYDSLDADTAVAGDGDYHALCAITLPAGNWVVNAHLACSVVSGQAGTYRRVSIGRDSNKGEWGYTQLPATATGITVLFTSRIITLSASTTVKLYAASGMAFNAVKTNTIIEAGRIR